MKSDIIVDGDEITVDPHLVARLLKTRGGDHRPRPLPRDTDDDAWDETFYSDWPHPKPRVWLGCVGLLGNGGRCDNAVIEHDLNLCYLHVIAAYIAQRQSAA